jgi:hypothetical protein
MEEEIKKRVVGNVVSVFIAKNIHIYIYKFIFCDDKKVV